MISVDLDDELSRHARKVGKVSTDRMLSPKFDTAHSVRAVVPSASVRLFCRRV
jgi:hypothetical protein